MKNTESKILQAAIFVPTSFLYKLHSTLGKSFLEFIDREFENGKINAVHNSTNDTTIYYRFLLWDSEYFKIPTYRIEFMTSGTTNGKAIEAYTSLLDDLSTKLQILHNRYYLFAEIPSEAIWPIQSLCLKQWRMVETRLTYYNNRIQEYDYGKRFPVRQATADDISSLRVTAMHARNQFDRFHADIFFSEEVADNYLATFVENSIKGFSDITLVPNPDTNPADAFLTANILPVSADLNNLKTGKMVLSAVSDKRRGWYLKLISEMSYIFKDREIELGYMTTQATNRAVTRTWEKLGYSLGRSSHVFVNIHKG